MPIEQSFKIGDNVVIRDWEDMENEFGPPDGVGDLFVGDHCYFVPSMRYLCGTEGIVTGFHDGMHGSLRIDLSIDVDGWNISPGMLRFVDEGASGVDRASFIDFLSENKSQYDGRS